MYSIVFGTCFFKVSVTVVLNFDFPFFDFYFISTLENQGTKILYLLTSIFYSQQADEKIEKTAILFHLHIIHQ